MKKQLLLSAFALAASVGVAQADTISGQLWHVSEAVVNSATGATPGNVPGTTPDVTFDVTFPLTFDLNGPGTVSAWLTTGGASNIVENAAGTLASLMDGSIGGIQKGTLVNLTGMISVTTGQIFTVTHDDGLTLTINGLSVVSAPGPTAPVPTTGIYTGASGTFNFQLVYTECCGGPAVLELQAVPGPIVGAGLPGLLFAGGGLLGWWRRKRKAEAAA